MPKGGVAAGQAAEATGAPSQVGSVTLDVMLAAEALDQDTRRNAAARRQGQAVLRGLGTPATHPAGRRRSARRPGGTCPTRERSAARPGPPLAAALDAIALGARVALARHAA